MTTKAINLDTMEYLIKRWTGDKVTDSIADRDTLEALVGYLIDDDTYVNASALITKWRKEKIAEDDLYKEPVEKSDLEEEHKRTIDLLLKTDLKHCGLDFAMELCKVLKEDTWSYVHENEDEEHNFRLTAMDYLPNELTEAEYLWRYSWEEFTAYLHKKYL